MEKIVASDYKPSKNLLSKQYQMATGFLAAYANPPARDFVYQLMQHHFLEAVSKHHPNADTLQVDQLKQQSTVLVNTIFQHLDDCKTPTKLFQTLQQLSRNAVPRHPMWYSDFIKAYQNYKYQRKIQNRFQLLKPLIKGDSLLDIGCGGGDVADYFRKNDATLKRVAGVDILDWRSPKVNIDYHHANFANAPITLSQKYHSGLLLAVLHHVSKDQNTVVQFLKNAKSAVSDRLIIEEDVLIAPGDAQHPKIDQSEYRLRIAEQPFYGRFIGLDQTTQRDSISIIDVLANCLSVGVTDMNIPFGYHSISQWDNIFTKAGYSIEKIQLIGFKKGNFNPNSHALFVLKVA